jgi:hypothetical protein
MKHLNFRLNWLVVLLLFVAGCETPIVKNDSSINETHGANGVFLYLHYYNAVFGDNQPVWDGQWYSRENLSIVAHLPSKSEFFIYVRKSENNNSDLTNNLYLFVKKIQEKSGGSKANQTWETISQEVSINKNTSRLDFNYLRTEFVGTRADTDRYSKSDQVTTVIYAACLTPEKPASKALYSIAIAMIPVNVSEIEKKRLLGILDNFLREKITYYLK